MKMSTSLSHMETWCLLALVAGCLGVLAKYISEGNGNPLVASLALSGIGFAASFSMIRWLGRVFMKAGMKGKDMAKPRKPEMYVYRLPFTE